MIRGEGQDQRQAQIAPDTEVLPLPFHSGAQLLAQAQAQGGSIAQVMRTNERHWRQDADIDAGLLAIWRVMQDCVARSCGAEGELPGGFRVRRRAPALHRALQASQSLQQDPLQVIDWVNLFALAVNEENAAGGRVVTAPTNGAAGIVPAVLHYYWRYIDGATEAGVIDFLLTRRRHRHKYSPAVASLLLRVAPARSSVIVGGVSSISRDMSDAAPIHGLLGVSR